VLEDLKSGNIEYTLVEKFLKNLKMEFRGGDCYGTLNTNNFLFSFLLFFLILLFFFFILFSWKDDEEGT